MLSVWSVLLYRSKVRPVLVSNDLAGNDASAFDRLCEKGLDALQVALFAQQHAQDLSILIQGAIEVGSGSRLTDTHMGFVDESAPRDGPCPLDSTPLGLNSTHEQGLGVNAPAGSGRPSHDGLFSESR